MIGRLLGLGRALEVNPNWSRRGLIRAAAIATGATLIGCRKKERLNLEGAPDKIKFWLDQMKRTGSPLEILYLADIEGSCPYVRLVMQEGTFDQFYLAASTLADSSFLEADTTIQEMINSSEAWEKALGMIVWGERVELGRAQESNPAALITPYLASEDPVLQLGAIVGLMRMGEKDTLQTFANKNQGTPVEGKINNFLNYHDNLFINHWLLYVPGERGSDAFQTAFFRNLDLIDAVAREAQTFLSPPLIWDIGCSSGLSSESFRIATGAEVVGTDICPFSLLYAERGKYLLESVPTVSLGGTEKDLFETYAQEHVLDAERIIKRDFTIEEGVLGPLYIAKRRDSSIRFAFDDIASPYSTIPDESIDIAVYTNVHYLLPPKQKLAAIEKIHTKLKPGGKVFVIISRSETDTEFEAVFGRPTTTKGILSVYVKR
ncbi:MAG: hypothetical protein HQ596_06355 [Candidatus Saganbacteria bacterium]|nr:hypothetical protein [Candidatus Saganbacteria bacterium]